MGLAVLKPGTSWTTGPRWSPYVFPFIVKLQGQIQIAGEDIQSCKHALPNILSQRSLFPFSSLLTSLVVKSTKPPLRSQGTLGRFCTKNNLGTEQVPIFILKGELSITNYPLWESWKITKGSPVLPYLTFNHVLISNQFSYLRSYFL